MIGERQRRTTGLVNRVEGGGNAALLFQRRQFNFELFEIAACDGPLAEHASTQDILFGVRVEILEIGLEIGGSDTIRMGADDEHVVGAQKGCFFGQAPDDAGFARAAPCGDDDIVRAHGRTDELVVPCGRIGRVHAVKAFKINAPIDGDRPKPDGGQQGLGRRKGGHVVDGDFVF